MRKVLFLMFLLLLMGLGAAGVKAQVRIGGNTPPNPAAALDLNAAEGTTTGTKGLALPRVTLSSNIATLDGATANIIGMLVYNTGGSLSSGVYYWDGSKWVSVSSGSVVDTTMLAPARANYQIPMYYNGKWRLATFVTMSSATVGLAASGNTQVVYTGLSGCLTVPITWLHAGNDPGFSWWANDVNCYVNTPTAISVVCRSACWKL